MSQGSCVCTFIRHAAGGTPNALLYSISQMGRAGASPVAQAVSVYVPGDQAGICLKRDWRHRNARMAAKH
jgi:hypothetical protein